MRQRQRLFCHNGAKVFTLCSSGSGKVACNVMQNILLLPFYHCHSHTEWGWNLFTCIAIAAAAQFEQVHLIMWNPIVKTEKRCHSRSRTVWTDLYHRLWLSTFFYRAGNGLQYPWTGLTLQFLLQSEKCDSLAWPRYRKSCTVRITVIRLMKKPLNEFGLMDLAMQHVLLYA